MLHCKNQNASCKNGYRLPVPLTQCFTGPINGLNAKLILPPIISVVPEQSKSEVKKV